MNTVGIFLKSFKNDPLKFIRVKSYEQFLIFFEGYLTREIEENPSTQLFIENFKQYVCRYFRLNGVVGNPLLLVKYYSVSDEQAFALFFDLFENFSNETICYYDDLYAGNIAISPLKTASKNFASIETPPVLACLLRIKNQPKFVGQLPSLHRLLEIVSSFVSQHSDDTASSMFLLSLTQYVFDFYKIKYAIRPSLTVIDLFTESDEAAFYKFYELLDSFLQNNCKS